MVYSYSDPDLDAYFLMSTDYVNEHREFYHLSFNHIFWNKNDEEIILEVDARDYIIKKNQILTTTSYHKISYEKVRRPLTTFAFNKEFYCVQTNDEELSCNGIIFYGSQEVPLITLSEAEQNKFELLYQVFLDEFRTRDNVQGPMMELLLKRLIIKVTRLARNQFMPKKLDDKQIDIIRKFNMLVDLHYKSKKQVSDYAAMLFKSPKTLSNLFARYNHTSPLVSIHQRIVLEAKRLLRYTNLSVKEIAYELGYEDVATLHKQFKKVTGKTPQQFKNHLQND
ncbi:MAG TPA: helix-turn-helix domain-containing protein [Cyclobacteriaceae bacterium]